MSGKVVLPSSLLTFESRKMMSTFNKKYQNSPLRMGCIVSVIEINDKNKSLSQGDVVEYDVVTEEQNDKSSNYVKYSNCISLDGIGGIGDFFEYKLRTSQSENFENKYDFKKQNGSMVLLLCLDGYSEKPIIIGGFKHPNRKTTLTKDAGLHLEGEYNGVNWQVNKDGELTITFKSKTDNDGKPQDETAGGTTVKMDKEGSVDINTNLEGDEETYIRMDKKNKDVDLKVGANIGFTAKKDVVTNADGEIKGKAKGSIEFAAEGAAKVSAKSSLDLEGQSNVNVKSKNVKISGQNGVIIEGQQCMINTQKVFVGTGGTPAVIATTKFVGSGNHGAPVTCSAVGPFSSSVFIAS
jgi:hypothetical protein